MALTSQRLIVQWERRRFKRRVVDETHEKASEGAPTPSSPVCNPLGTIHLGSLSETATPGAVPHTQPGGRRQLLHNGPGTAAPQLPQRPRAPAACTTRRLSSSNWERRYGGCGTNRPRLPTVPRTSCAGGGLRAGGQGDGDAGATRGPGAGGCQDIAGTRRTPRCYPGTATETLPCACASSHAPPQSAAVPRAFPAPGARPI